MNEVELNIPAYINSIRALNLTLAGKIALIIFNEDAIKHADDVMLNANKMMKNPFGFFRSVAGKYCEDNGITISYYEANKLAAQAGIDLYTAEKVDAQNPQPSLQNPRSTERFPKRGNSSNQNNGPKLSMEERLANSAKKYQTVMRPFWGRPETLTEEERKTLLIQPEQLKYEKEISTANEYWNQTVDCGFSSDYCMKELNEMVEKRNIPPKVLENVNNPAAASVFQNLSGNYLDGMIMNMSKQYMFALIREEKAKKEKEAADKKESDTNEQE